MTYLSGSQADTSLSVEDSRGQLVLGDADLVPEIGWVAVVPGGGLLEALPGILRLALSVGQAKNIGALGSDPVRNPG